MGANIRQLLALPHAVYDGDELVVRYDLLSVLVWCLVPLFSLLLGGGLLLWARWLSRREHTVTPLWIVAAGLLVFTVAIAGLIVPAVALDEVRVSDQRLEQTTGFWFSPVSRGFPLAKIQAITPTTEPGQFGLEAVWIIHWSDRPAERFNPGDLIAVNETLFLYELRRRGVVVHER